MMVLANHWYSLGCSVLLLLVSSPALAQTTGKTTQQGQKALQTLASQASFLPLTAQFSGKFDPTPAPALNLSELAYDASLIQSGVPYLGSGLRSSLSPAKFLETTEPTPALTAQTETAPPSSNSELALNSLLINPRVGVRYTTEGAGYQNGFTSFEAFFPLFQEAGANLTYLEGRLLLQNNSSTLGSNVVLGQRFLNLFENRMYGVYVAYDTRNTGRSSFNQVGVGFENLGQDWDARINGYIPVGITRNPVSSEFFTGTSRFSGNFLLLDIARQFEAAAWSVDAELGGKIMELGSEGALRGYAGVYYLNPPGSPDALGVKGRLQVKPSDFLDFNVSVQNDKLFDTRVVLGVGVTFPGSSPSGSVNQPGITARLGESVERLSAIIVADPKIQGQTSVVGQEVAINDRTGRPYTFLHVASGGNSTGAFEDPYSTVQVALAEAQRRGDVDVIYVRGSGTEPAQGENPIANLVLPNGLSLLSNGIRQLTPDSVRQLKRSIELPNYDPAAVYRLRVGRVTLLGNNVLRGFTVSQERVLTTSPVTVAGDNVTVANLIINNPPGSGIQASNVSNLTLQDNTINNSQGPGVQLTNVNNLTVDNTVVNNPQGRGFDLKQVTGNVVIKNSGVSGTEGDNNSAFALENNSGSINLTLENNQFQSSTNNGVFLDFTGTAQGNIAFTGNTISGNSSHGLFVQVRGGASISNMTIANNTISDNEKSGIFIFSDNQGQGVFNISNNTITNNTTGVQDPKIGLYVLSTGNSQLQLDIQGNTLTNNPNGSINLSANSGATIAADVDSNSFTAPNFQATAANTSKICLQLTNNTPSGGGFTNVNGLGFSFVRGVAATFATDFSGQTGVTAPAGSVSLAAGNCP